MEASDPIKFSVQPLQEGAVHIWNWESFPDYLKSLEARAWDADVGAYIPHSPLRVYAMGQRGLDRAISSAGGIARTAVDAHFMLNAMPGVFAAGEMLDWDAPTGGYLLQASFATGLAAARGIEAWLAAD